MCTLWSKGGFMIFIVHDSNNSKDDAYCSKDTFKSFESFVNLIDPNVVPKSSKSECVYRDCTCNSEKNIILRYYVWKIPKRKFK